MTTATTKWQHGAICLGWMMISVGISGCLETATCGKDGLYWNPKDKQCYPSCGDGTVISFYETDGVTKTGEACDDGQQNGEVGEGKCLADCSVRQTCGDGYVHGDEMCDDGNAVSCDGCSALCLIESQDATLKTLTVQTPSSSMLTPTFQPTVQDYLVETVLGDARAQLTVETNDSTSTVVITDANTGSVIADGQDVELPIGETTLNIVVTASTCDTQRTYTVTIKTRPTAIGAGTGDEIGYAVALDGTTLVVGAPFDDDNGDNAGAAYVFERQSAGAWVQQQKLTASMASAGAEDWFGSAVVVEGDTMIVGAPGHDYDAENQQDAGAVYVFERSNGTWEEKTMLEASNVAIGAEHYFGHALALDGDVLAVGAPREDEDGSLPDKAGAVFVFRRSENTWEQEQAIRVDDPNGYDYMGACLALDGNLLAVSGYGADKGGGSSGWNVGAVYLFKYDDGTWVEQMPRLTIIANDTQTGGQKYDELGYSIGLSNNVLALGAHGRQVGNEDDAGAVFIFEPTGSNDAWVQTHTITDPEPTANARFGGSLAMVGDVLVVGSPGKTPNAATEEAVGAVHRFARQDDGSWAFVNDVPAPDPSPCHFFGFHVALSDTALAVGAIGHGAQNTPGCGDYVYDNTQYYTHNYYSYDGTGAFYVFE